MGNVLIERVQTKLPYEGRKCNFSMEMNVQLLTKRLFNKNLVVIAWPVKKAKKLIAATQWTCPILGLFELATAQINAFARAVESMQSIHVLCLMKTVVSVDGELEKAVTCIKVVDGIDSCTDGFLSVQNNVNKFVMAKELYKSWSNLYKQSKGRKNMGMTLVVFCMKTSTAMNETLIVH